MGYPMTFRRVLNRNQLAEGDYGTKLSGWNTGLKDTYGYDKNDGTNPAGLMFSHLCDELDRANGRWSMLCGDLRRLEADSVDEAATCKYIAAKTGIDPEVVAAVLKEFIAW